MSPTDTGLPAETLRDKREVQRRLRAPRRRRRGCAARQPARAARRHRALARRGTARRAPRHRGTRRAGLAAADDGAARSRTARRHRRRRALRGSRLRRDGRSLLRHLRARLARHPGERSGAVPALRARCTASRTRAREPEQLPVGHPRRDAPGRSLADRAEPGARGPLAGTAERRRPGVPRERSGTLGGEPRADARDARDARRARRRRRGGRRGRRRARPAGAARDAAEAALAPEDDVVRGRPASAPRAGSRASSITTSCRSASPSPGARAAGSGTTSPSGASGSAAGTTSASATATTRSPPAGRACTRCTAARTGSGSPRAGAR